MTRPVPSEVIWMIMSAGVMWVGMAETAIGRVYHSRQLETIGRIGELAGFTAVIVAAIVYVVRQGAI